MSHPLQITGAHSSREVRKTWMSLQTLSNTEAYSLCFFFFYFNLTSLLVNSTLIRRSTKPQGLRGALSTLTRGSAFPLFWTNHCSLIGLLAKSRKRHKRLWPTTYCKRKYNELIVKKNQIKIKHNPWLSPTFIKFYSPAVSNKVQLRSQLKGAQSCSSDFYMYCKFFFFLLLLFK